MISVDPIYAFFAKRNRGSNQGDKKRIANADAIVHAEKVRSLPLCRFFPLFAARNATHHGCQLSIVEATPILQSAIKRYDDPNLCMTPLHRAVAGVILGGLDKSAERLYRDSWAAQDSAHWHFSAFAQPRPELFDRGCVFS